MHSACMLIKQLARIDGLAHLNISELKSLGDNGRVLCLPPRRPLVQAGRELPLHMYLLKGSIVTVRPNRRWRYRSFGALKHFYPGCEAARTHSASHILCINSEQLEFLQHRTPGGLVWDEADAEHAGDAWLARFLSSQMMKAVSTQHWRELLRGFERHNFAEGQAVLSSGDAGDCCYVVEQGHAVVHAEGHTLKHLSPGDFFGEDALILNGRRSANVTALEPLVVHSLQRALFENILLAALVQPVAEFGDGLRLDLSVCTLVELRRRLHDLTMKRTYYVVGGEPKERILAAFILRQHGLKAQPVCP